MKTPCPIDDSMLVNLINSACKRTVVIASGVELTVAKAIDDQLTKCDGMDITVILEADKVICRIGFGDIQALQYFHTKLNQVGFALCSQQRLRVGVLLADEKMLVWSPTPRSVEAPPSSHSGSSSLVADPVPMAPNGLMLGDNPREQLAIQR